MFQDSLVVCRLKRNAEFRLNDASNRASSSQMHGVNSRESNCAISEAGIDQRGVCEHDDKGVGCSSKRSSSSYGSPSVEQIDSASESNQRPANDATLTESSSHLKVDSASLYLVLHWIKLNDSCPLNIGALINYVSNTCCRRWMKMIVMLRY